MDKTGNTLPVGWEMKKIKEVCIIGDGNHSSKYPKKAEMADEWIPFIRSNNLVNWKLSWKNMKYISAEKHQEIKKGHLKTNDILFTNRGEIWKLAIVSKDFDNSNLNSQIAWFRCLDNLNNKFLYYFLSSPIMTRYYLVEKNGAALQQFTISKIKEIKISFPTDIHEQKRIGAILDEVFENIDEAKKSAEENLMKAKQVFESYLQRVFEEKGEDWEEKELEKVCEKMFAGWDVPKDNFSKHKTDKYQVPIYANWEKNNWFYGYTNIEKVSQSSLTISARWTIWYIVERNETYFPIVRLIVLIPNKDIINLSFLKYWLKTLDILQSWSSIPQLTIPMIRKYNISYPKVINKQKEIVEVLDELSAEIEKLEELYRMKCEKLEELKKSVLQEAFSGNL